ncbi:MAG: GNAT family N-acetyltransferase [Gammaproteobacteria bacterium]|nr:GNAT family N-acetyltransferase [Gammaproteobacteria bacterium]
MSAPEILTNRLLLTSLRPEDAEELFRYRADPQVARYQSWAPRSQTEARKFIADLQLVIFDTPGSWYQLAIRSRKSGALMGDIGIHFSSEDPGEVEIGFTVAPAHQLRGYGSEAVGSVLECLFTKYHKQRVCGFADPRNLASQALMRRIGMRREADAPDRPEELRFAVTASRWHQDS